MKSSQLKRIIIANYEKVRTPKCLGYDTTSHHPSSSAKAIRTKVK